MEFHIYKPSPFKQGPGALGGKQLKVLDIEDRRLLTEQPVHEASAVMPDEERGSTFFQTTVGPAQARSGRARAPSSGSR